MLALINITFNVVGIGIIVGLEFTPEILGIVPLGKGTGVEADRVERICHGLTLIL